MKRTNNKTRRVEHDKFSPIIDAVNTQWIYTDSPVNISLILQGLDYDLLTLGKHETLHTKVIAPLYPDALATTLLLSELFTVELIINSGKVFIL